MSNYTPATNFGAKDALVSGNPSKAILGAEFTTEFTAIATMSATKEDSVNKGVNNGYAGLDSSGDVFRTQLPGAVAYEDEANVFTLAQTIQTAAASDFVLWATGGAADAKRWAQRGDSSGTWSLFTQTDAGAGIANAISITRSGTTVGTITLAGTSIVLNGVNITDYARLSQSNVFLGSAQTISNTAPHIRFDETDAGADERAWMVRSNAGRWLLSTATDASPTTPVANAIDIDRSGTTVTSIALAATTISLVGQTLLADGTFSLPSSAYAADPDTGHYRSGSGAIGVASNGVPVAAFDSRANGSFQVADEAGTFIRVGYREIPLNSQSGNYTAVAADAGKGILHPSGAGAGDTFTIPSNASVPYPIGTVLTFPNRDSNSLSVAITSDTLILAGSTTTGTRTIAQNGVGTAIKVEATVWLIGGPGVT